MKSFILLIISCSSEWLFLFILYVIMKVLNMGVSNMLAFLFVPNFVPKVLISYFKIDGFGVISKKETLILSAYFNNDKCDFPPRIMVPNLAPPS
jgi:hypothetical protein